MPICTQHWHSISTKAQGLTVTGWMKIFKQPYNLSMYVSMLVPVNNMLHGHQWSIDNIVNSNHGNFIEHFEIGLTMNYIIEIVLEFCNKLFFMYKHLWEQLSYIFSSVFFSPSLSFSIFSVSLSLYLYFLCLSFSLSLSLFLYLFLSLSVSVPLSLSHICWKEKAFLSHILHYKTNWIGWNLHTLYIMWIY